MKNGCKHVLLFGFFIALLGIFHLAFAQDTLLSQTQRRRPQGQRPQTIEEKVQELTLELNLTEKQSLKITEILNKSKEKIGEFIEEISDKIRAVKKKADSEVQGVLTKEQRLKYKGAPEPKEEEDEDAILKVFQGVD
jgi:hypothetical protein